MIFDSKTIRLGDGRPATLRSAEPSEADEMLKWLRRTAGETEFIIFYPEECDMPVEVEAGFIERLNGSPNEMMIVCYVDGEMAGNCQLALNSAIKTRHRGSVSIGIAEKFWGLGIGTAMFTELIGAARERGVTQLELDYIDGNERAAALYRKMGFEQYGRKPNGARLRDGSMRDYILMVKYL